jgi:hypothetical protein
MKQTTLVFGEIKDIPNSNWIISGIKLHLHDQFKEGCYSLIGTFSSIESVHKSLYDKYESFISFPNKSLAQNDTILICISIYYISPNAHLFNYAQGVFKFNIRNIITGKVY